MLYFTLFSINWDFDKMLYVVGEEGQIFFLKKILYVVGNGRYIFQFELKNKINIRGPDQVLISSTVYVAISQNPRKFLGLLRKNLKLLDVSSNFSDFFFHNVTITISVKSGCEGWCRGDANRYGYRKLCIFL